MSASERLRTVATDIRKRWPHATRVSIALCGSTSCLQAMTRSMLRMGSFRPPPEAAPRAPVPHALSVMPLDQSLDLEVIGVPLEATCAPMWPLALTRANLVIRLERSQELLEACALVGVVPLDARQLSSTFAEDDEEEVAHLLRAATSHL